MRKLTCITFAFVAAAVLALNATTAPPDNNLGTWKMNVAKSKFSPGPAPKSQTLKIEAWGEDGVKYIADGVDGDGKTTHWELQAKYDGKFYAFKGNPDSDMLAYKRIDANTVEARTQRAGKETGKTVIVVSKDGKTRTLTQTGTNAKGEKISNSVVYDKQ
jgi:hypothetical protein